MTVNNRYIKIFATLITVVVGILCVYAVTANAAFNRQINYQGKLTNSSNVAVTDGTYNMRFKLYTTPTGNPGTEIWSETWCYSVDSGGTCTGSGTNNRVQVTNGLFSVMLGSTTPLTGVDFNQTLYLGVEIGGSATTPTWDGEMLPRKKFGAVPAAFVADTLQGLSSTQFFRTDAQNATSSTSTFLNVLQTGAGKIAEFFGANSASVFTALSNGNVGVGTSSPYATFSVNGQIVAGYLTATTSTASTLPYASSTALTISGTASSSAVVVSNSLKIGTLTGALQAINGTVSATSSLATIYGGTEITNPTAGGLLAGSYAGGKWQQISTSSLGIAFSNLVGTLGVSQGGTGATSFGQGWLYSVGGTNAIAASTSPTVNYITATSTTAYSTLAGGLDVHAGTLVVDPTTNNVGVGTTSPYAKLSVVGQVAAEYFTATSTTGASTFAGTVAVTSDLATGGALKIGGSLTSATFRLRATSNGIGRITNTSENDFTRLQFGQTGSTYPALQISASGSANGNAIQIIAADGAANANLLVTGNAAVGTTSPYAKLTTWGSGSLFEAVTSASSTVFSIGQSGATTTAFAISSIPSSLLKTNANGSIIAAVAGTDYLTSANIFAFPYTKTTFGSTNANSTSTLIGFTNGIYSLASSTIGGGTQTTGLTINGGATTTGNAYFGGTLGIGTTSPSGQVSIQNSATSYTALTIGNGTYQGNIGFNQNLYGTNSKGIEITSLNGVRFNNGSSGKVDIKSGVIAIDWDGPNSNTPLSITRFGSARLNIFDDVNLNNVVQFQGNGTANYAFTSVNNFGVGTSTPYSKLTTWGSGSLFEAVTSASSTVFSIGQSGATTTAFAISSIPSSLLKTNANGSIIAAVAGTDYLTSANIFAFPYTKTTFGSTNANSTSTLIGFTNGIYSLASSTIGGGTQTTGLTINGGATTTGNAYFAGNVGIGTASPVGTLDIGTTGGLYFGNLFRYLNMSSGILTGRSTSVSFGDDSNAMFQVYGNGTNKAYFRDNLGIGSTTPFYKLSVEGDASVANNVRANYFTATSTTASVFPYASSTAITVSSTASTSALIVSNSATIGTLTGILQGVNGLVSASSTLSINYGGTGLSTKPAYGQLLLGDATGAYALTATSSLGINSSQWITNGSNIYYNTGSVGIGTSTPTGTLNLSGTAPRLTLTDMTAAANQKHWYLQSNAGYLYISTTSDALVDKSPVIDGQNQPFLITPDGKIGIGTAFLDTISTALQVGGDIGFSPTTGTRALKVNQAAFGGSGGSLSVSAANGVSSFGSDSTGGSVSLTAGDGASGTTAAVGGAVNISGGASAVTGGNNALGGNVNITGGTGAGTSATLGKGGDIIINGGNGSGAGNVLLASSRGSVGVGTTSPFARLSVSSLSQQSGTLPLFQVSSTTNSTLFTVLGNGLVGIGTANPSYYLDVSGTIRSTSYTTASYFSATSATTASTFPYASSTALTVSGTASTTNLFISSVNSSLLKTNASGQVVAATAGTDYLTSANIFAFPYTKTTFGSTNANSTSTLIGFTNGIYSLASSTIGGGTQTTGLTINGGATTTGNAYFAGNVGVGVNNATLNLQVAGSFGANTYYHRGADNLMHQISSETGNYVRLDPGMGTMSGLILGNNALYVPGSGTKVGVGSSTPYAPLSVSTAAQQVGTLPLFTIASTTNAGLFTVLGNGNTGVGVDAPQTSLHVANGVGTTNGSGGGRFGYLSTAGAWGAYIAFGTSNGYFTGTNFGIGSTTPFYKLSVEGDASFANNVRANYFTATSTTASVLPYASTTALTVSGTNGLQLASGLNGLLQSVAGLVTSSSTLSINYGGTGLFTKPAYGNILVGQANGSYALTATSSLGLTNTTIQQTYGTAQSGAITFATSSQTTNGLSVGLNITNTGGAFTFTATSSGVLTAAGGGTSISNPSAAGILLGSYAGGGWQQLSTSTLGLLTTNVAEGTNLYYLDSRVQSFIHASTTIPKTYTANTYTAGQTFSNGATTTALAITSIPSALLKTNANGSVIAAIAGTDYLTSANIFAFPFTTTSAFSGSLTNSTSTLIGFTNGIYSLASSTIGGGTQTTGLTINGGATTTGNAYFAGNVGVVGKLGVNNTNPAYTLDVAGTIGNSEGGLTILAATGFIGYGNTATENWGHEFFGSVKMNSTLEVSGDITTSGNVGIGTTSPWRTLSVNGSSDLGVNALAGSFTATSSVASTFPYASSTALTVSGTASTTNLFISSVNSSLLKTNASGQVVAATAGTDYLTSANIFAFPYTKTTFGSTNANSTSTLIGFTNGIYALASSTIGNGLQGLTNYGNSTTTGTAYFARNVGVGTSTPSGTLTVSNGNTGADLSTLSDAHMVLDNTNASGQNMLTFAVQGTPVGGIRGDFQGNFNWHATGPQGHQFYTSLDTSLPVASFGSNGLLVKGTAGATSLNTLDVLGNAIIGSGYGSQSAPANGLLVEGNVGIGSVSPGRALEVEATGANVVQLRLSTSPTTYWDLGRDGTNGNFRISGSTAGNVLSIVDATGNTGLGTTSPYAKLSVVGQVVGAYFTATTTTASTFPYASTTALSATSLCLSTDCRTSWPTSSAGGGVGWATSTANSQSVYFYGTGNVGIGSSTPFYKLSVEGNASVANNVRANYFTATSTTATSTIRANLTIGNPSATLIPRSLVVNDFTSNNTPVARFEYTGGTGAIEIIGNTSSASSIYFGDTSDLDLGRIIYNNSTSASGANAMRFVTANTEQMRINSSGFVGIGTTTPTNYLTLPAGSASVPSLSVGDTGTGIYRSSLSRLGVSAGGTAIGQFLSTGFELQSSSMSYTWNNQGGISSPSNGIFRLAANGGANMTRFIFGSNDALGFGLCFASAGSLSLCDGAGNATTTKFGVGTTTPWRALSVNGSSDLGINALAGYFTATSTTASVLPYASTTALTVSGTNGLQLASGLNGLLQSVAGLVTSSSTLSINYGGTGLFTKPAYGNILVGQANGSYALTATSSLGLGSKWTSATGGIYYNSGNVGIGDTTPIESKLIVDDTTAANTSLAIFRSSIDLGALSNSYSGVNITLSNSDTCNACYNQSALTVSSDLGGQGLDNKGVDVSSVFGGVGDAYGLYVGNISGGTAGALNRSVGLYLGSMSGSTNNYGILQADVANSNYFAGSIAQGQDDNQYISLTENGSGKPELNFYDTDGGGQGFIDFWTYAGQTVPGAQWAVKDNGGFTANQYFRTANFSGSEDPPLRDMLELSGEYYNVLIGTSTNPNGVSNPAFNPFFGVFVPYTSNLNRGGEYHRNLFEVASSTASNDAYTSALVLSAAGKLGIGSSTPFYKLSVEGDASVANNIRANYFTSTSTAFASTFPYASTTALSATSLCLSTDCRTSWPTSSAGGGVGWATSTANSQSVYFYGTGNVGIGSSTPFYKLSVEGSSSLGNQAIAGYFTATSTATSTLAGYIDVNGTNGTSTFASNLWVKGTLRTGTGSLYLNDTALVSSNGNLTLSNNATSTIASGFTASGSTGLNVLQTNGYVGIGKANPTFNLDVLGTARVSGSFNGSFDINRGNGAGSSLLTFSDQNDDAWYFGMPGGSTSFAISEVYPAQNRFFIEDDPGTGSADQLYLKSGGNVGIGTNSPFYKLSAAGSIGADYFAATSTTATSTFAGSMSVAKGIKLSSNGTFASITGTPFTSPLWIRPDMDNLDGSTSYDILSFGDDPSFNNTGVPYTLRWFGTLGIPGFSDGQGTAIGIYSTCFHTGSGCLTGSSGLSGTIQLSNGSSGFTTDSNLAWDTSNDRLGVGSSTPFGRLSVKGAGASTGQALSIGDSNNATRLVVQDNGSTVINTSATNPSTLTHSLHIRQSVVSGPTYNGIRLDNDTFSVSGSNVIDFCNVNSSYNACTARFSSQLNGGGANPSFDFWTANASKVLVPRFGVTRPSDGYFYIGTSTSPYTTAANAYAKLYVWSNGTGTGQAFELVNNASTTLQRTYDNGTTYLVGPIGIATTSPWKTFSVNGNVALSGLTSSIGAGSLCLTAGKEVVYNSGTDACLSSLRATKHDIEDLELSALSAIQSLNPVSFVYNEGDGRTRYGFIAEDAAAVDDHFATHDELGNISGIDDRALVATLVKGIQEQQGQIGTIASTSLLVSNTSAVLSEEMAINTSNLEALTTNLASTTQTTKSLATALDATNANIAELSSRVNELTATTSSIMALFQEMNGATVDNRIAALTSSSTFISTIATAVTAQVASSTAELLASSTPSFIARVADSVKNSFQTVGEWTMDKLTARIVYTERVEAQTVAVSKGLEINDVATGQVFCVQIRNGEWDKRPGACTVMPPTTAQETTTTTNPPVAQTTIINNTTTSSNTAPAGNSTSTTSTGTTSAPSTDTSGGTATTTSSNAGETTTASTTSGASTGDTTSSSSTTDTAGTSGSTTSGTGTDTTTNVTETTTSGGSTTEPAPAPAPEPAPAPAPEPAPAPAPAETPTT